MAKLLQTHGRLWPVMFETWLTLMFLFTLFVGKKKKKVCHVLLLLYPYLLYP